MDLNKITVHNSKTDICQKIYNKNKRFLRALKEVWYELYSVIEKTSDPEEMYDILTTYPMHVVNEKLKLINKVANSQDNTISVQKKKQPKKIILRNGQSPGDIVMMTALVRDIHKCYPGKFITDVQTSCKELWENNPYITPLNKKDKDVAEIRCEYPLIHNSNSKPYHFIHGFIEDFNNKMGVQIKPSEFKGDIHISDEEKNWYSQVKEITGEDLPYWIIISGGKFDYTAKWWNPNRAQEVVNHFKGRLQFVQMGSKDHYHPKLNNVIDLVGKTDLREAVRAVYHSAGIVCPVTMYMHLAPAIECYWRPQRPCVVLAGGREGTQWEMYPNHQYLHTIGMLKCCEKGGCWKSRVKQLDDNSSKNKSLCERPVISDGGIVLPKCMDMITTQNVIESIEKYLEYDKMI